MRFAVLGPLEVSDAGGSRHLGGPHQRAVLAALLAHRGRVVTTDVLVEALWGGTPPRTAEHTLRTHVSRLRRLVGGALVTRDGGYLLDVPAEALDSVRFEALVASAAGGGAVGALSQALGLWRGPAYAGLADVLPVRGEARRLEEARASAREALVGAHVAAGAPATAVAAAEALVAEEPYREPAWALLVGALVAAGRPAQGLDAYRRAARALAELGLDPSPVLREAQAGALRAGDVPVPASQPASPGTRRPARSVPVPASSLVGREADVAAVVALLGRARLVTLLGPGGVGKTRLALAVARELQPRHTGGCRVVELAPLRDAAEVPAAVAAALDVAVDAGPASAALARAGELDVLVLLDNCEHVVDAVAAVAETMLGCGDRLHLLATSRERLGVPGEHVHAVRPLAVDGRESPAHRLFVERAAAAGAAAGADADVERLVRRLDGLPLAIEMAAARTATIGPAELAERLADRLDTLRDPRRRGNPRHRTLGAVIEWSRALLDDGERAALAGWTVFAGAVPLADAAAVLDVDESVVEHLAERSLLALDTGANGTRYRMLQTVRAVVRGQRGQQEPRGTDIRRRHALHFTDVAVTADAELRGPGEAAATQRLDTVTAELREAHAWARTHDPSLAVRLSRALHLYAANGLHDEVFGWIARLAPAVDGDDAASAVVDAAVAARLALAGEFRTSAGRAARAVALAGDELTRLRGLESLADVALYEGRLDDAAAHARAMVAAAEAVGDVVHRAMGTASVCLALGYGGGIEQALAELAHADAEIRAAAGRGGPPPTAEGWLVYCRGELVLDRDPSTAITVLRRAVELADSVGNRYLGGVARVSLTSLEARAGEPHQALQAFDDVVRHWLLRGNHTHLLTTLRNLVGLFVRVGDDAAAAELWGAVSGARLAPTFGAERARLEAAGDTLAARLGPAGRAARVEVGAARTVPAAATAALAAIAAAAGRG